MTIVKDIIKSSGGSLVVESEGADQGINIKFSMHVDLESAKDSIVD